MLVRRRLVLIPGCKMTVDTKNKVPEWHFDTRRQPVTTRSLTIFTFNRPNTRPSRLYSCTLSSFSNRLIHMGCQTSRHFHADHVDDSIHAMLERERRRSEQCGERPMEYQPRMPHPLLTKSPIVAREDDEESCNRTEPNSSSSSSSNLGDTEPCSSLSVASFAQSPIRTSHVPIVAAE